MTAYSCSKTIGPRGASYTYQFQDGWRTVIHGRELIRIPNMVEHTTKWKPMSCGILPQQGLPPDPDCKGCANAKV